MTVDHTHRPLDEEVTAIGGSYRLIKESRLDVGGRDVLYLVGHGEFDTTCCGAGGCGTRSSASFSARWDSPASRRHFRCFWMIRWG